MSKVLTDFRSKISGLIEISYHDQQSFKDREIFVFSAGITPHDKELYFDSASINSDKYFMTESFFVKKKAGPSLLITLVVRVKKFNPF